MGVLAQFEGDGRRVTAVFEIPEAGGVVGREEGCAINLIEASVSRRHAQLVRHEQGWMVVALSQANPVLVNGRSSPSAVLRDGDRVTLGTLEMRYFDSDPRTRPTVMPGGSAPMPPPAPPRRHRAPPPIPVVAEPPGFFSQHGAELVAAFVVVGLGGAGGWWWWTTPRTHAAEPEHADVAPAEPSTDTKNADAPPTDIAMQAFAVPADGGTFEGSGFSLEFSRGQFPSGTSVGIRQRTDLPALEGMKLLAPPIEVETGDLQPAGDVVLRIPIERAQLPDGKRPLVVSPMEDGRLRGYPSYYDPRTSEIVARVHHFSLVYAGYALLAGIGAKLVWDGTQALVVAMAGEDIDDFPGKYTSPGGVDVYFDPKMFGGTNKTPKYVVDTGAAFDDALSSLDREPAFGLVKLKASQMPAVVVVDTVGKKKPTGAAADVMWGNAVAGDTAVNLSTIAIQLGLGPRLLSQTAIHESTHVWQIRSVGWSKAGAAHWWKEASAEWVGWTAHPAVTRESNAGQYPGTNHVETGFYDDVEKNSQYSLGDWAMFVEQRCPGVVLESWAPGGFVSQGIGWYEGLTAVLKSKCSLELEEVLGEYLVRHGLPAGTPRGLGGLPTAEFFPPSRYVRHTKSMPAVSNTTRGLRVLVNEGPFTLVIREAAGRGSRHHVRYGMMPATKVTNPPLGHNATGRTTTKDRFGGPRAAVPGTANVVYLVSANPTDDDITPNVELYLLSPPTSLSGKVDSSSGKDEITISWTAPPLALGKKPADDGALAKIRVYQKLRHAERRLDEVDAKSSSYTGTPNIMWDRDQATFVLRAVDKYGRESENSVTLQLKRKPKKKPTVRKPKPKPRTKPRPSNPCSGCNMSGPECNYSKRQTRCWKMGCCE